MKLKNVISLVKLGKEAQELLVDLYPVEMSKNDSLDKDLQPRLLIGDYSDLAVRNLCYNKNLNAKIHRNIIYYVPDPRGLYFNFSSSIINLLRRDDFDTSIIGDIIDSAVAKNGNMSNVEYNTISMYYTYGNVGMRFVDLANSHNCLKFLLHLAATNAFCKTPTIHRLFEIAYNEMDFDLLNKISINRATPNDIRKKILALNKF